MIFSVSWAYTHEKIQVRNAVDDFRPTDYFTLDENEAPSHASSSDQCGLRFPL